VAYIWGRPNFTPIAIAQSAALSQFAHWSLGVPPQYLSERPWPLYIPGHDNALQWMWMDPVYPEYRDVNYPLMGQWPPPQPGAAYDQWTQQQRQWMPYEQIAYSGVNAGTPCSGVRGVPLAENQGQIYHFDFTSQPDWPFVTAWTGVRLVAQINKHSYVTNEGTCNANGPTGVAFWIGKSGSAYPTPPSPFGGVGITLMQSFELNDFGLSPGASPYGANVGNFQFETTSAPAGVWDVANADRFWFYITQTRPSGQGSGTGQDNIILGVRKVWAAAIVTLGGTPSGISTNTGHISVVG
jgi:hypothetical protein